MKAEFYHDRARDFLIYRTQDTRAAALIRDAKPLTGGYIAVPRTLYNCQLLRWLDLSVPPIMDRYDWPRNQALAREPTEAQKTMANFLALHARSFNLSDMGTMKTLAALWAADFVMSQYPQGECRALIVAPLSTLQRVWGDALFNHFIGRRTFTVVHSANADKRVAALAERSDFYIINFDGLGVGAKTRRKFELAGLSEALRLRSDIRIAIVDEASAYRDRRTRRHKLATVLLGQREYLWLLTGSPTPNAPTDAYGLAKLVNGAYGESYTSFHRRTMVQLNKFKWIPARGSYQAAAKLLQPSIRYAIEDVWDGPECTIQQRDISLSDAQHKLLSTLKNQLSVQIDGKNITPPNEAAIRTKALQIVQGAIYDGDHLSHEIGAEPRINELKTLIDEATKKVLVFVPLTNIITMLSQKLTEAGYGVITLNGQTKNRDEAISAFAKNDEIRVAIADPSTVAHGINEFVAATTVVWYGPTDKTELWLQGNKRAHRPGQKFPVTIVQLCATALERGIYKRLESNEGMQGALLDWIKGEKL